MSLNTKPTATADPLPAMTTSAAPGSRPGTGEPPGQLRARPLVAGAVRGKPRRRLGDGHPRHPRASALGRKLVAVFAAAALLAAAVNPAGAHLDSREAGGDCPHWSQSLHHSGVNGTYTVYLRPDFDHDSWTCQYSQVIVSGLNINGNAAGWTTEEHGGDPGVRATWIANDIRWTKHNVLIRKNGREYWGGLTIYH